MTPHLMGLLLFALGLTCSVLSALRMREVLRQRRAEIGDFTRLQPPDGSGSWLPQDYELARQVEGTALHGRPIIWMAVAKLLFGLLAGLVLAIAGGAIWWATRGG